MFRWIIGSSLRFRYLVVGIGIAMVVFGMGRLREMPVDVFPEFAPPIVELQVEGPGMSSTEIEELVTVPFENVLRGTPELDVIRSRSVIGLAQILMIFERGTDVMLARQRVQERMQQALTLIPASAGPPVMIEPLSATSRVIKIGLESEKMSLMDLSMIGYWTIRMRLMRVPGVANVAIWGERLKAMMVQVDPKKLQQHHVTLNKVEETLGDALDFNLQPFTRGAKTQIDGFIETPNQRLDIQHVSPVLPPEKLARMPIRVEGNGEVLRLADIGDVKWDHPLLIGDAVINDGPGLMLIVAKFPWANTLEVTRGVEAAMEELKPGLPGIKVDSEIFRPATFIELSVDNLTTALLLGALLVIIVLGAFLWEWRTAFISIVAIPLSLVAAGLVLYLQGATINTMVLAGLIVALGAVVDDAIIDIENIVRRLRRARREGSTKSTALIILEASLEIRSAIVYATLIIVLAVMPVFFMGGLSGSFFEPLAHAYILALLASMVVAMTITPALALIMLRNAPLEKRESPLVRWLTHHYEWLLKRIVAAPRNAFIGTGLVVAAGVLIWPQLGQSLLPDFKERDFLMHWLTKPGTSHPDMYRITVQASKELRAIPGVRNFGAHIGRAVNADEPVGIDFTENWVSVDPKADYDKTLKAIQDTVNGYPGIYRDVQTYLKERIREVLTGAGEAIVVRIYGDNLAELRSLADDVNRAMTGIDGLIHLHTELVEDVPQVQVKVDLAAARAAGLKPGDVRRAAATILAGLEVSDIHEAGKVYEVMVWSVPEARSSVTDVRNLLLDTPDGGHVRLQDVADVSIKPVPNVVKREGVSRRIDVVANVGGRDLGSVVRDVERRLREIQFPTGYHAELIGEFAERQKAQQQMLIASLVAAIGIFFLLQASFDSWRLATFAFFALPSALVGGIIAAWLGDGVVSLGTLVGFLTVLGIAARNGILMISHFQFLELHEGERFGPALVLRGAKERLAPILMTATTTGLALLPLVLAGSIPGHEIEHPMAVVSLGGLITSTMLNLFVVPSLYLRYGRSNAQRATGSIPATAS